MKQGIPDEGSGRLPLAPLESDGNTSGGVTLASYACTERESSMFFLSVPAGTIMDVLQ